MIDKIKGKESKTETSGNLKGNGKEHLNVVNITIAKLADEIIVRKEEDIDEISDRVVKKITEVAVNMA